MRRTLTLITALAFAVTLLTGCGNKTNKPSEPLLGLTWFTAYEAVMEEMSGNKLIEERESTEKIHQRMQDYGGIPLYGQDCDLTLCFTDSGLVGLNYHDIQRSKSYREWFGTLEGDYGLPTEEGSGMASWYDDPLGKNTAIYLFNLEEGVQVSFYASADSPDKTYEKHGEAYIPTPELRSPVLPVSETPTMTASTATAVTETASDVVTVSAADTSVSGSTVDEYQEEEAEAPGETNLTVSKITTTTTSTTAAATTTTKVDRSKDFLLGGLQFYGSIDSERRKMSGYTKKDEYRTDDAGQPWEQIVEYENVPYLGKKCDTALCFTSLGLVGVNYFDHDVDDYSYWLEQISDIYGAPDKTQYDYSAWTLSPVGSDTMIYVFKLEDSVQISFFADDTGSEKS